MEKTLLLGYGNLDRQDDGVAWHVLAGVEAQLGREQASSISQNQDAEEFDPDRFQIQGESPELLFVPQLTPELAETIAGFDRVCFIDAHTGRVPDALQMVSLQTGFQASPFTHHLAPESLLSIAETLYGRAPQATLVSVRGYEFGFAHSLSPRTAELALKAAEQILAWL